MTELVPEDEVLKKGQSFFKGAIVLFSMNCRRLSADGLAVESLGAAGLTVAHLSAHFRSVPGSPYRVHS